MQHFLLIWKKNREYEECSLGVCGFGQCGLDHISHLPSFTDMSRHGDARCEESPLRVICEWSYVPSNENSDFKTIKVLLESWMGSLPIRAYERGLSRYIGPGPGRRTIRSGLWISEEPHSLSHRCLFWFFNFVFVFIFTYF
jgi:hypothetical protein